MNRTIVILLHIVCQVFGDVWLSRGMRNIGAVNVIDLGSFIAIAIQFLTSPWIWLGIAFLITSLILYLVALSRFDLSYVLPITAFTYVLSTALAIFILREHVSAPRLFGTCIITAGAFVVGWDEQKQSR
ncbi:hypothetical protein LEP3755_46900 [Leptolyngbya sp. NIES-3755]|nr:hypothetical protein LEP3755_46900 [Leptolyngbya sp. NIES-3755]